MNILSGFNFRIDSERDLPNSDIFSLISNRIKSFQNLLHLLQNLNISNLLDGEHGLKLISKLFFFNLENIFKKQNPKWFVFQSQGGKEETKIIF